MAELHPCPRCGKHRTARALCAACRRVKDPTRPPAPAQTISHGPCRRCGKDRRLVSGYCAPCRKAHQRGAALMGSPEHKAKLRPRRAAANPAWVGGRTRDVHGYILVRPAADDPIGGAMVPPYRGYVQEHRLVVAHWLGRPLLRGEVVHHLNGVRDDNRLENLRLFSSHSDHFRAVHYENCPHCGASLRQGPRGPAPPRRA